MSDSRNIVFNKQLCRFFNKPGGCRYGDLCRYEHIRSSVQYGLGFDDPRAPPGVCKFFWSKGFCARGFTCSFKHGETYSDSGASPTDSDSEDGTDRVTSHEENAGLLIADDDLSSLTTIGSDAFRYRGPSIDYLDPQQVQDELRLFLIGDFVFRSSRQVYMFADLLLNATSANTLWSDMHGQLFLEAMSSERGLRLLQKLLVQENVAVGVELGFRTISFRRGYIPVFQYLSSKFVIRSNLDHHVNALYSVLDENIDTVIKNLSNCLDVITGSDSDSDIEDTSGAVIFSALAEVFFQYLTRFKDALARNEDLGGFVLKLEHWVRAWYDDIHSPRSRLNDPIMDLPEDNRQFVMCHIKSRAKLVSRIVEREQRPLECVDSRRRMDMTASSTNNGEDATMLAALCIDYVGPGELREDGPRHDNDFVDIRRIRIIPTEEELTCRIPPFLPGNIPNAPHPYLCGSIERLLDIQFRLLREEMIASLRGPVQAVADDMASPNFSTTQLANILKNHGGSYRYQDGYHDAAFNVYTKARFLEAGMDPRRGLVLTLRIDSPPGDARSKIASERVQYWSSTSNKRLMHGALVALVRRNEGEIRTYLGILSCKNEEIAASSRYDGNTIEIGVVTVSSSFLGATLPALDLFGALSYPDRIQEDKDETVLVESHVLFEAFRPFLESLQALRRIPEVVPFADKLVHPSFGTRETDIIPPPAYSLHPNFSFDLSCLLREDVQHPLRMVTTDSDTISHARDMLKGNSRLDDSQAEAIVNSLTREISLVQSPPGTGKTFMGIELIRVLIQNGVGPILLVAVTNHALDHMLFAIVTSGITERVIRLGGHSMDDLMQDYSIESRSRAIPYSNGARETYRSLIRLSEDIDKELYYYSDLEPAIDLFGRSRSIGLAGQSDRITAFLRDRYPDHAGFLEEPPDWISSLYCEHVQNGWEGEGECSWKFVRRNARSQMKDSSLYEFWRTGADLQFNRSHNKRAFKRLSGASYVAGDQQGMLGMDEESTCDDSAEYTTDECDELEQVLPNSPGRVVSRGVGGFDLPWSRIGFIPRVPQLDRPLESLLFSDSCDVWNFSERERARVHAHWTNEYRQEERRTHHDVLLPWLHGHALLRKRLEAYDNQRKLCAMLGCKIIGCTTTGAVKSRSILQCLSPKVIIVEEAGQVLEGHIIANLLDSVQHLIMIGDPLQLRPSCSNYALSVDNPRGGRRFRFDVSLMERLSSTGTAMSRLNVQRRMRPEISSLIRNTLYPDLSDDQTVLDYPHVRGMAKDVFFYSHEHPDNGGCDESASRYNMLEVAVIKDIVKHLLRQGCYSSSENVVILCSYIGQLAKVTSALQGEMMVDVDERDQEALAAFLESISSDFDGTAKRVLAKKTPISQKIKVRTVDNFQGEEAEIIILSLVRNSGKSREEMEKCSGPQKTLSSIGFLKSENRTNVAISRARHGLYILGNAWDFASQSGMWCSIITELERNDAVGDAIPIKCNRHREYVKYISEPGQLPEVSPDGGCLRNCGERLACGHSCSYKCHSDDEDHVNVYCSQPCPRLCPRNHPCPKRCGDPCGRCEFLIRNVILPCGHMNDGVP